ncbi:hypothetical protein GPECTOR_15g479 [Gonium pectorale]|uniref:Uncharacterized protein n=1 Tax=Gonium pectorale TaxID=33097 RepID=A0A150GLS8_GONPE|nr:hypothetical protein GPECTOR_15g479 [Gonium pectorale]|eukprot:KXZ50793.1 hypothetical protein GPECTOR_15g479 [Gonium pectorale]
MFAVGNGGSNAGGIGSSGWGRGGGGGDAGHGSSGDFGDGAAPRFTPLMCRALLGGLFLTVVMAVSPPPSHATPGIFSRGSPPPESMLSTSAPSHHGTGSLSGLANSLERSSWGGASSSLSRRGSATSSPSRPRSKVMHVACKGSTLVVPLPASGAPNEAAGTALHLWQRPKVVEAPIQLSESEARMLASRQNRVRDSLFVQ